jgi:hypothetical protein
VNLLLFKIFLLFKKTVDIRILHETFMYMLTLRLWQRNEILKLYMINLMYSEFVTNEIMNR